MVPARPLSAENPYAVSLIAETPEQLKALIADAREAVFSGTSRRISGRSGIVYTPRPTGTSGDIAFVFPGSGNHYVGMGRTLAVTWPEILREMDAETPELKTQMVPAAYVPFRKSWASGWETEAMNAISADPLIPIFGQVVHGSVMTRLIKSFGIFPQAMIGYSLGETAAPLCSGRLAGSRGDAVPAGRKFPVSHGTGRTLQRGRKSLEYRPVSALCLEGRGNKPAFRCLSKSVLTLFHLPGY